MVWFYCVGCVVRKLGKDFIFNRSELSKSFSLPLKTFRSCYHFRSASPIPYNFQSNLSVVTPATQESTSGNCSSSPALPSGPVSLHGSLIEPAPSAWCLCLQTLIMQYLMNNPSQDVLPAVSQPGLWYYLILSPSTSAKVWNVQAIIRQPGWTEDIPDTRMAVENRKTPSQYRSENTSPGKEKRWWENHPWICSDSTVCQILIAMTSLNRKDYG